LTTYADANLAVKWTGWDTSNGSTSLEWNTLQTNLNWSDEKGSLYFKEGDAVLFPSDLSVGPTGVPTDDNAPRRSIHLGEEHDVASMLVEGLGYVFSGQGRIISTGLAHGAETSNIESERTGRLTVASTGSVKFLNAGVAVKELIVDGTAQFLSDGRGSLHVTGSTATQVSGTLILGYNGHSPFVEYVPDHYETAYNDDGSEAGQMHFDEVPSNYDIHLSGNGVVAFSGNGGSAAPYEGHITTAPDYNSTTPGAYAVTKMGKGTIHFSEPQTYAGATRVIGGMGGAGNESRLVVKTLGATAPVGNSDVVTYSSPVYNNEIIIGGNSVLEFALGEGVHQTCSIRKKSTSRCCRQIKRRWASAMSQWTTMAKSLALVWRAKIAFPQ
jgi:hypothetical protein